MLYLNKVFCSLLFFLLQSTLLLHFRLLFFAFNSFIFVPSKSVAKSNTYSIIAFWEEKFLNYKLQEQRKMQQQIQNNVKNSTPEKIAILYIALGRYGVFWKDFYRSCEKYFLSDCKKTYFLWTDNKKLILKRIKMLSKSIKRNWDGPMIR